MKSKSETSGTLYRFSSFVVRARWAFIALFLVAMILCAVFIPMIEVKYDLSSYMPEDSKTNIALSLLKEQFDDKGMAYVMVKGVSEEQATELAGTIGSVDGVNMATKEEAAKKIKCDFRKTEKGYVYTITFDQRYLEPIVLRKGFVAGFGLFLHDRDDASIPPGLKGLSLATEPGAHCDFKPHLWPLMILAEE